jgi:hypothetical protein
LKIKARMLHLMTTVIPVILCGGVIPPFLTEPRKLMDSSKLNQLGWQPKVCLQDGLNLAYKAFLQPSFSPV